MADGHIIVMRPPRIRMRSIQDDSAAGLSRRKNGPGNGFYRNKEWSKTVCGRCCWYSTLVYSLGTNTVSATTPFRRQRNRPKTRHDDKQNARVYSLEIVAVNGQNGEKYCFVTAYITDFTANGKKAPKPDFGFLNMTIPYILTATVRAPNVRVQ